VAAKGVTVNAVCPGFTDTELVAKSVEAIVAKTGRSEEEARAALASSNPQGRLITPDEVAQTIVWLCGDGASGINGAAVPVAGGELGPPPPPSPTGWAAPLTASARCACGCGC